MLGLRNLEGVHRLLHFKKGDTLASLYIAAAAAYDMPAWAVRLIHCGIVVPTLGIIDDDWTAEFLNATVIHIIYRRTVPVRLPDTSSIYVITDVSIPTVCVNDLFVAVGEKIGKRSADFFLEINGSPTQYGDGHEMLPNTLSLTVTVSFASPLRWKWIQAAISK